MSYGGKDKLIDVSENAAEVLALLRRSCGKLSGEPSGLDLREYGKLVDLLKVIRDTVHDLVAELAGEAEARSYEVGEKEEIKAIETMNALGVELVEFPEEEQRKLEEKIPDFLDIWVEQQKGTDKYEVAGRIADYIRTRAKELN